MPVAHPDFQRRCYFRPESGRIVVVVLGVAAALA